MRTAKLSEMTGGWFVGMFEPSAFKTDACEVALKSYAAGAKEELHHHRVATEITLIVSGRVRMAGAEWGPGDIVVLDPGDATAFEAITDCQNLVVKLPGALGDKYLGMLPTDVDIASS